MKYETLLSLGLLNTEDIRTTQEKLFVATDVFNILSSSYKDVKGGLHFKDIDDLIVSTSVWKVIYFEGDIVGLIIYKSKKGLKMVALGVSNLYGRTISKFTKKIISYIFKLTFSNTWMEVSEGVEKFIIKNGGEKYFISNKLAEKLTGKEILHLDSDNYHYIRDINGVLKRKVIVGTAKY